MLLISWKYHCVRIVDSVPIHENTGYRNLWYTLRDVLFSENSFLRVQFRPPGIDLLKSWNVIFLCLLLTQNRYLFTGWWSFGNFSEEKLKVNQKRNSVKCFLMSFEQQVASRETEFKLFFKAFIMFFIVISQSF